MRDPGAVAFDGLRALQFFQPPAHPPPRVKPGDATRQGHRGQSAEHAEPPCLPEMRQHFKLQARAGFVPHAVIVAHNHLE